jgi:hypothetical protein
MKMFVNAHARRGARSCARMCRRILTAAIASGTWLAGRAYAQPFAYAGGGASVPMGDFGDYANTGWMAVLGVGVPVGHKGLSAGAELLYGSNAHKQLAGDRTNLPGALAWGEYRVGDNMKPGPYVVAMAGLLDHQFKSKQFPDLEESEWKALVGIGVGVDIPFHGNSLFIEGRYLSRGTTTLAPVMAGLTFPISRRK